MTQEVEANDNKKSNDSKKSKNEPKTKVVVRRLPPTLTNELFLESVEPLAPYNYYYYAKGEDNTITPIYSRAYINFIDVKDVWIFQEKFDGYVFMDNKGNEYPAVVEYAPYPKIPKSVKKKPDSRINTIENDAEYLKFLIQLNSPINEPITAPEITVEEIQQKEKELKSNKGQPIVRTPLVDFIFKKREEIEFAYKRARDERRKKDIEKKKLFEERREAKDDKHNREKKDETGEKSYKDKDYTRDSQYRNKSYKEHDKQYRENTNKSCGKVFEKKESIDNIQRLKVMPDKVSDLDVGYKDKPKEVSKEAKDSKANISFTEMIINKLNESELKKMVSSHCQGDNNSQVNEVNNQNSNSNLNKERIGLNLKWNEYHPDQDTPKKDCKENQTKSYNDKHEILIKNSQERNFNIISDDKNRGDILIVENKVHKSFYDERRGSVEITKTKKSLVSGSCESIEKSINNVVNNDDKNKDKKVNDIEDNKEKITTTQEDIVKSKEEDELARKNKIKNKDRPERAIYVPSHRRK